MTHRTTRWSTALLALALLFPLGAQAQNAKPGAERGPVLRPGTGQLNDARVQNNEAPAPTNSLVDPLPLQGFTDATFPPTGWARFGTGGTSTAVDWARLTTTPCSVANPCARANWSSTSGATVRYLATPQFTPASDAKLLTFKAAQSFTADWGSIYRVMVSTTSQTDPAAYTTLAEWTELAGPGGAFPVNSFGNYSVDLSAYVGVPIYIAFYNSQNDGDAFWLDDVRVAAPVPISYVSSANVFQNTGNAFQGSRTWIGGGRIVADGTAGTLEATSLTFTFPTGTNPANVSEAYVLPIGSGTTFDYNGPRFGTIMDPGATMTFTGTTSILPGNNHFVLVYVLKPDAVVGQTIDADFTSATVGGIVRTPSPTSLTGFMTIAESNENVSLAMARPVFEGPFSDRSSNGAATTEPGEAAATCAFNNADTGNSVWWSYVPSASGTASFGASGFDTILSAHEGSAHPLTELDCSDDFASTGTEVVSFPVTAGQVYWIRVTGWGGAAGNALVTMTAGSPAPVRDYTVTAPDGIKPFNVEGNLKLAWTGPGVPLNSDRVRIYLRREGQTMRPILDNLANKGKGAYAIPLSQAPARDYEVVVVRVGDPTRVGSSATFSILNPAQLFTINTPVAKQVLAIGSTRSVSFTRPSGAATGQVRLTLYDAPTKTAVASALSTNASSMNFTFPSDLPAGSYYFGIELVSNTAYYGVGAKFKLAQLETTGPVAGASHAAGSQLTITWDGPTLNAAGIVAIQLKRAGFPSVKITPKNGEAPFADGTYSWTIPADQAPAGDYYIGLKYTYNDGTTITTVTSKGGLFTITGPAVTEVPPAPSYFAVPASYGTEEAALAVAVALPDGAEVAAYAGTTLVGAAVVRDGLALVSARGALIDAELVEAGLDVEDALVEIAEGTALTLRAWTPSGGEVELATTMVRDEETNQAAGLVYVDGASLVVTAAGAQAHSGAGLVEALAFAGVRPNPVSGAAAVTFTVRESQSVRVEVYDVAGRRVATLYDGVAEANAPQALAVASGALPAGVYVVRLTGETVQATQRFTVTR